MSIKTQIRKSLLAARRAMPADVIAAEAKKATKLFASSAYFLASQNIACYYGREDEFDCMPIIEEIWRAQKRCYLPVLSRTRENSLDFYHYEHQDTLRLNKYNILEPLDTLTISPDQLDLVIVPLVAFDLQGNRIGMGAGYYDRTFSFLKDTNIKKPILLGLAFDYQQVEALPYDQWDIPLNAVLTEKNLYVVK